MTDHMPGIWGSKNIAPEPIICTRHPKIGTDGVFQTYLENKKVAVVREKTGPEGGGILWREKYRSL